MDRLALEQDASLSLMAARLRGPERVPQSADDLNYGQRELDHTMRCRKVGCTRCAG